MDQHLETLGVKLIRALTEVRYDRSLLFDDLKTLNQLSKGLKEYFGQSQKDDQNNALVFINPEKQFMSVVRADLTNVDIQNPLYKDFESLSTFVMGQVSKKLDVEDYSRLGTRLFFGKPVSTIEEGQEIIRDKFFLNFQKGLNSKVQNPQLAFTFQKSENYFINASLRVESNTSFKIDLSGVTHSQSSFIVIDLDIYTNKTESYDSFLKSSKEIGLNALREILKLLEV